MHGVLTGRATPVLGGAAQRGHEPVEALELKMFQDPPSFINVRFAGYACCSVDISRKRPGKRGNGLAHEWRPGLACLQVEGA